VKAVVGVAAVLSVEDSIVAGKRGELSGGESRKHKNEQMLGLACFPSKLKSRVASRWWSNDDKLLLLDLTPLQHAGQLAVHEPYT